MGANSHDLSLPVQVPAEPAVPVHCRAVGEGQSSAGLCRHPGGRRHRIVTRRRNLVAAPRLCLTGDAAEDKRRRTIWRRTFAGEFLG